MLGNEGPKMCRAMSLLCYHFSTGSMPTLTYGWLVIPEQDRWFPLDIHSAFKNMVSIQKPLSTASNVASVSYSKNNNQAIT